MGHISGKAQTHEIVFTSRGCESTALRAARKARITIAGRPRSRIPLGCWRLYPWCVVRTASLGDEPGPPVSVPLWGRASGDPDSSRAPQNRKSGFPDFYIAAQNATATAGRGWDCCLAAFVSRRSWAPASSLAMVLLLPARDGRSGAAVDLTMPATRHGMSGCTRPKGRVVRRHQERSPPRDRP